MKKKTKQNKPTDKQPSVQVIKSPFQVGLHGREGWLYSSLVSSVGVRVEAEFGPLFPYPAPGYTSKIGYGWS